MQCNGFLLCCIYILFMTWHCCWIMSSLPELNCVLLVHLWMRSVKELLKIRKISLILMMRKGNYWYVVVVWRIYHPFVTIMNKFTLSTLCWCMWILSIGKGIWEDFEIVWEFISLNIRPSQIACTVTTVHITCMQTALCIHENLCTVLIPLSNNLNNLLMSFFSGLCLVGSLIHRVVILTPSLCCADFFVCLYSQKPNL